MGALANAATLMKDPLWRDWITAASSFVASEVYAENPSTAQYAARRRLALDVITAPEVITSRMLTLVSVTQVVAEAGPAPSAAHEPLVLERIRQLWTPVALQWYPEGG